MAIGFVLLDTITVAIPDKMLSRKSTPKVNIAKFGDGYEQRLQRGINPLEETYSVSFVNRPKEDIDDIIAFFESKGGVTSFLFTIPDSNAVGDETSVYVVCDSWDLSFSNCDYYQCTANFRRVYEP